MCNTQKLDIRRIFLFLPFFTLCWNSHHSCHLLTSHHGSFVSKLYHSCLPRILLRQFFLSFQIFFFDSNLCWGLCSDWILLTFSLLIYCMNVLSCSFFKPLDFHLNKSFIFFWNLWLGHLFSFRPSLFFFFLFFWNLWQGRLFFFSSCD